MGYERLFPKQREAVEAFISGSDVAIRVFYRLATERASVSLSLSVHGLLPHRHTLGTEPTLLNDPLAHTQVLHTAGWSHIQLPLTCWDINTWLSNWLNSFWTRRCSTCCQTPSRFFRKGSGNETNFCHVCVMLQPLNSVPVLCIYYGYDCSLKS